MTSSTLSCNGRVGFCAIGAFFTLAGLTGCGGSAPRADQTAEPWATQSMEQTTDQITAAPLVDLHQPALLFKLPAKYQSPDGMTLGADGSIYLSMNNAGAGFKFANPAKIMRIAPDDKLYEFANLVPGAESKIASPLGLSFAQDGNLYVSDAQCFAVKTPNASRIQRVVVQNGKAVRTEVVASGLNMANGLVCRGEWLYVCDSFIDTSVSPIISGVYRIKLDELVSGKNLRLTGIGDRHLLLTLKTEHPEHKNGANGLGMDAQGNLYVCNFGDREVWKATFKADGTLDTFNLLAKDGGMESCDGLQVDAEDNLWVADFLGNAIFKINAMTGQVTMIAKNGHDNIDVAGGALHAPSECIRRGNRVYVANIDLDYGPNKAHELQTISVITLKP